MDQPKHISLFVNANSCSGAILSWVYIDTYPHTFIHLIINSNIEMDIINCSHGGLSFLEGNYLGKGCRWQEWRGREVHHKMVKKVTQEPNPQL